MNRHVTFSFDDIDAFSRLAKGYFLKAGFELKSESQTELQFTRGNYFLNMVTFNPLKWKSLVTVRIGNGTVTAVFDINSVGQLVTVKEEEAWDKFVENFVASVKQNQDLSAENNRLIADVRLDFLRYVKWALMGSLVFGIPFGLLAYVTGIVMLASIGAANGAILFLVYAVDRDRGQMLQIEYSVRSNTKRVASYFKSNWDIDDYPVYVYRNKNALADDVGYGARILNWGFMVAHGETKEKALEQLTERFRTFKEKNKLPRPGTRVPLEFASSKVVERYDDIASDFFKKVLKLNYRECFTSDESSLMDFESMDGNVSPAEFKKRIIHRVQEVYGVDISHAYDMRLTDVFEKVKRESRR